MKPHDEMLLRTAVEAIKADQPDAAQVTASARRVAGRFGLDAMADSVDNFGTIGNCVDVLKVLKSYRAGTLSSSRSLMIEAHLRDCGECFRRAKSGTAVLDWSAPKAAHVSVWRPRAFGWALAPACALLVCGLFVYRVYWQGPPGVRAEVQSIDGSAYLDSDAGSHRLAPGDKLAEGDHLRTSGGAHAVLRL